MIGSIQRALLVPILFVGMKTKLDLASDNSIIDEFSQSLMNSVDSSDT
jgi:hypothetical protein